MFRRKSFLPLQFSVVFVFFSFRLEVFLCYFHPQDGKICFLSAYLTFCVSKLFESIIPSRLLFFLESNSNLSSRLAVFCPSLSTRLNSIIFLIHFGWVLQTQAGFSDDCWCYIVSKAIESGLGFHSFSQSFFLLVTLFDY